MLGLRNIMQPSSTSSDGIITAVYAIFLITLIEQLFKYMPIIAAHVYTILTKKWEKKLKSGHIPIFDKLPTTHTITLVRNYESAKSPNDIHSPQSRILASDNIHENELVDAMIDHITNVDSCKHLRYTNRFIIDNQDTIQLTHEISASIVDFMLEENGIISRLSIKLESSILSISEIKAYIERIYRNFQIEKKNKLGTQRYYFDEIEHRIDRNFDGTIRLGNMPKRLQFNMVAFNTHRSMNNIFGDHLDELKERVRLFQNHPEWYRVRGIPYTLGILMYGKPGCGKTSMIKAIAKDLNRHIINISLREHTTQRQLHNLFFDENIIVQSDNNQTLSLTIPLDQRIYVIEDIDCLTSVVLDRSLVKNNSASKKTLTDEQRLALNKHYDELIAISKKQQKYTSTPDSSSAMEENIMKYIANTTNPGTFNKQFNEMWNSQVHDDLNDLGLMAANEMSYAPQGSMLQDSSSITTLDKADTEFIEIQRAIHLFDPSSNKVELLLSSNMHLFTRLQDWIVSSPIEYSLAWLEYCRENIISFQPEYGTKISVLLDIMKEQLPHQPTKNGEANDNEGDKRGAIEAQKDLNRELINLSYVLNLLDGVLETPGRILIMTSNYPEKLDRALVRPGRVDVKIEFGNASKVMIKDIIKHFYALSDNVEIHIPDNLDWKFSPAKIIEACCNNSKIWQNALESLNTE